MNIIKNKKYYLSLPYNMVVKKLPDNEKYKGEYIAYYKEYPKVIGSGKNELKAVKDLKSAFECLVDDFLDEGIDIIEPKPAIVKKRVNIMISEDVLDNIKNITKNRSAFLEEAAKIVINNKSLLHNHNRY